MVRMARKRGPGEPRRAGGADSDAAVTRPRECMMRTMRTSLLTSLLCTYAVAREEVTFSRNWRFHFGPGGDDAGAGPGNDWAAAFAPVASCAAAHFNALRVDGIDLIFPSIFYDAADAAGILIYHDAQYSQGNPMPIPNPGGEEEEELRHTARKLASHPSLATYDGCNECGGYVSERSSDARMEPYYFLR